MKVYTVLFAYLENDLPVLFSTYENAKNWLLQQYANFMQYEGFRAKDWPTMEEAQEDFSVWDGVCDFASIEEIQMDCAINIIWEDENLPF